MVNTTFSRAAVDFGPIETRASLILRLADAADVSAWDDFLQIYRPLILRLAMRQGLQAADAEDLAQEVFSSVASSVNQWLERKNRGGFRAWLVRIARNATVNMLTRRAYRRWGAGGELGAQQLAELPANDYADEVCGSEFELEYRRQVFQWAAAQVRDAVTEATWEAFWLTHVCGNSIEQAAVKLGLSTGKVYVARSRVMARLRDLVNQYEVQS